MVLLRHVLLQLSILYEFIWTLHYCNCRLLMTMFLNLFSLIFLFMWSQATCKNYAFAEVGRFCSYFCQMEYHVVCVPQWQRRVLGLKLRVAWQSEKLIAGPWAYTRVERRQEESFTFIKAEPNAVTYVDPRAKQCESQSTEIIEFSSNVAASGSSLTKASVRIPVTLISVLPSTVPLRSRLHSWVYPVLNSRTSFWLGITLTSPLFSSLIIHIKTYLFVLRSEWPLRSTSRSSLHI